MSAVLVKPQALKRPAHVVDGRPSKKTKDGQVTFVPRDDKSRDSFNALVLVQGTNEQTIRSIQSLMTNNRHESTTSLDCIVVEASTASSSASSVATKSMGSGKPAKAYFVLGKILSHLDDPTDLRSSIRASPALLAAFRGTVKARTKIMKQVIVKAIKGGAMDAALGLLYCPRFEPGDEKPVRTEPLVQFPEQARLVQPKISKWEAKVVKFLRRSRTHFFEFPDEHADIVRLYQHYSRVNRMLPYFADWMLAPGRNSKLMNATTPAHSAAKLARYHLSARELGRLQRALFNYETHCRLMDHRAVQAGVQLPSSLMNLSLPSHECEEVLSLRIFIAKQYGLVFGELEATFSQYLNAQVKKDTSQPDVRRYDADTLVWNNLESFPWLEQLYRGSQRDQAEREGREFQRLDCVREYINVLVGCGLRFLDHFTHIPAATRGDFIKETMYPILSLDRIQVKLVVDGTPAIPKDVRSTRPNEAWKAVARTGGSDPGQRHAFRKHGWVFWDVQRLKERGLLTRDQLLAKAAIPDDDHYRARCRSQIPGLDEKFRRLFFTTRIKKEWSATVSRSVRDQKMVVDWLTQIQASAPVEQSEWYRELKGLRSSKSPRR